MTNSPAAAHMLVGCDQAVPDLEAHILEGGPNFPDSVQMVQANTWLVRIPSPQITPQNPMLVTIGYNNAPIGKCWTEPQ